MFERQDFEGLFELPHAFVELKQFKRLGVLKGFFEIIFGDGVALVGFVEGAQLETESGRILGRKRFEGFVDDGKEGFVVDMVGAFLDEGGDGGGLRRC